MQRAFGKNLRAYREALGLSQEKFAAEFDIHRTYVGAVERGERNLTLLTVEYYCTRLGVDPLEMLRETTEDR